MPACLGLALTAHELAAQVVGPEFRAAVSRLVPLMSVSVLFASFRAFYLDHAFQLGHRSGLQVTISAVAAALALGGTAILGAAYRADRRPAGDAGRDGHLVRARHRGRAARLGDAAAGRAGVAGRLLHGGHGRRGVALVPSGLAVSLYAKVVAGGVAYAIACIGLDVIGLRSSAVALLARATPRRGTPAADPAAGAGAGICPAPKASDRKIAAVLNDQTARSMGQ